MGATLIAGLWLDLENQLFGMEIPQQVIIDSTLFTAKIPIFGTSTRHQFYACQSQSLEVHLLKSWLISVLYLENSHVTQAFPQKRLEVLRLLCAQAAVTIEKAEMYRSMEEAKQAAEAATLMKSTCTFSQK